MKWLKKIIGKNSRLCEDFEIELGPEWEPQHEDTHFGWADEADGQQVIISVLRSRQPLDKPTFYIPAMQQIAMKQAAARQMSGDNV